MSETKDDGVNREGLDFRAGWLESLTAFLTKLQVASMRCKKNEAAGLQTAHGIAMEMRAAIIQKMRGQ